MGAVMGKNAPPSAPPSAPPPSVPLSIEDIKARLFPNNVIPDALSRTSEQAEFLSVFPDGRVPANSNADPLTSKQRAYLKLLGLPVAGNLVRSNYTALNGRPPLSSTVVYDPSRASNYQAGYNREGRSIYNSSAPLPAYMIPRTSHSGMSNSGLVMTGVNPATLAENDQLRREYVLVRQALGGVPANPPLRTDPLSVESDSANLRQKLASARAVLCQAPPM